MKTCTKCNEIKEKSNFYKNKNAKDGLSWQCKLCATEVLGGYYTWRFIKATKVVGRFYGKTS
jgi:hypothetical protein